MSGGDPLLALALRTARRWLAPLGHAAAPVRRRAQAVGGASVVEGVARAAAVLPQHPRPGSLPQAGQGDTMKRGDRPAPAFPLPLAQEGDARRRMRVPVAPLAERRLLTLPASEAVGARPGPTPPMPRAERPWPLPGVPESPSNRNRPAAAAPLSARPMPPGAVAPVAVRPLPAVPAAGVTSAAPPTPWMAPAEPPAPPGPPPLDEDRLASWLSAHLAAEARRPARGGTGFDPRLSPAWPGTLQGPWGWGG